MWKFVTKNKYRLAFWLLIFVYTAYFSIFSILRYQHLYAEYFDLGIMHQTTFNTYQAYKTGDLTRILEMTAPYDSGEQIKRMAIHNDPILALVALFYFVYSGPETLLVIQTVVLALGALAVFKIAKLLLKNDFLSLVFSGAFLMYYPMQRANIFEFHAVTFATAFILFFFYFWLTNKIKLSFLFLILALLTKEQVGLTLGMFGLFEIYKFLKVKKAKKPTIKPFHLSLIIIVLSWGWALFSTYWIIPFFRGGPHFASGYFFDAFSNPSKYIFVKSTFDYLVNILAPLSFLTILEPIFLLVALPELAINLLSSNSQLRSLEFQYVSVIQPWLFIGAIYGSRRILNFKAANLTLLLGLFVICFSLYFSYLKSPLPYSLDKKIEPWINERTDETEFVKKWQNKLADDNIKVSSTDQIAPFFTSRRYFYIFSDNYQKADYIILSLANIGFSYRKEVKPAYEELKNDSNFEKIDENMDYEIYRKLEK